jgi:DNA repair photolyase
MSRIVERFRPTVIELPFLNHRFFEYQTTAMPNRNNNQPINSESLDDHRVDGAGPVRQFRGRGSSLEPANRFERVHVRLDLEQLEQEDQAAEIDRKIATEYFFDDSGTVVSENQSPDVDFNYSLNPYRGCAHGCSYCYARPTHEYLGFNAGIDFESKIVVKPKAPELFRKWLLRPKWKNQVEPVMLSGVTDCYQSCEKKFQLTRRCLEIALEMQQPIRITTKNGLIRRDLDILAAMAELNLIAVNISVSSLDQSLIRVMEPRSSSPQARLDTIHSLTDAGVPVKVLVAPIIPGINDEEIPVILETIAVAGARSAGYVMLRLPLAVEPVFLHWLDQYFPDRKEKIVGRIQSLRNGKMNDSGFDSRMKGQGIWADQIRKVFDVYCAKHGLTRRPVELAADSFRTVRKSGGDVFRQKELF